MWSTTTTSAVSKCRLPTSFKIAVGTCLDTLRIGAIRCMIFIILLLGKVRRSKSDYSALIEGETESNVEYSGRLATKRQLYALFCATRIRTTGAKIPFERAKELDCLKAE